MRAKLFRTKRKHDKISLHTQRIKFFSILIKKEIKVRKDDKKIIILKNSDPIALLTSCTWFLCLNYYLNILLTLLHYLIIFIL